MGTPPRAGFRRVRPRCAAGESSALEQGAERGQARAVAAVPRRQPPPPGRRQPAVDLDRDGPHRPDPSPCVVGVGAGAEDAHQAGAEQAALVTDIQDGHPGAVRDVVPAVTADEVVGVPRTSLVGGPARQVLDEEVDRHTERDLGEDQPPGLDDDGAAQPQPGVPAGEERLDVPVDGAAGGQHGRTRVCAARRERLQHPVGRERRHRAIAVEGALDQPQRDGTDLSPFRRERERPDLGQPDLGVARVAGRVAVLGAPVAGGVQQRQVTPPRHREVLQERVGVAGTEVLLALEDVQHVGGPAVAGSGPAADLGHGGEDRDLEGSQPGPGAHGATITATGTPPSSTVVDGGQSSTKTSSGPQPVANRTSRQRSTAAPHRANSAAIRARRHGRFTTPGP